MDNTPMKTNGILIALLLYICFFGVKVNFDTKALTAPVTSCKTIDVPKLGTPPAMPVIDKEYLDDKSYIIRVLINHINVLNKYAADNASQANLVYNAYTKCITE